MREARCTTVGRHSEHDARLRDAAGTVVTNCHVALYGACRPQSVIQSGSCGQQQKSPMLRLAASFGGISSSLSFSASSSSLAILLGERGGNGVEDDGKGAVALFWTSMAFRTTSPGGDGGRGNRDKANLEKPIISWDFGSNKEARTAERTAKFGVSAMRQEGSPALEPFA